MSPFSHGNIIVAIIGCCLVCVGNCSQQKEDKDGKPDSSMPGAPSGGLPGQQGGALGNPDTDPALSKVSTETRKSNMGAALFRGLDGKPVNMTLFLTFLQRQEFHRQLNRDAEWAFLCLVGVICAMMWMMWWAGGLKRCRHHSDESTPFSGAQPFISVHEVVRNKRQYLPMFNEPEWEEVLMCNRGTDP